MMSIESEFKEVGTPGQGMAYRGVPFWSWNDTLEEDELRHQIREMKAAGLGGYFMHARTGLGTRYMGEQWMKCIAACLDEGKRQGMKSWLYDEDGFPSGMAGGLVPSRGADYAHKVLLCRERSVHGMTSHRGNLKAYLGRRVGQAIVDLEEVTDDVVLASAQPDQALFEFYYESRSCVDLLNPKVVQAFIETTHDAYYDRFRDEFGPEGNIPGIFTDEPPCSWFVTPWTEDLPLTFQQRRGYCLLEHLPSIFYEVGDFRRVRHDFYRTVTEMFVETYSKRVFEWCAAHGTNLTGHHHENDGSDTLWWQVGSSGAVMPHYEYMQIPGIDHLNCQGVYQAGQPNDLIRHYSVPLGKQVSSVAHQFGRQRMLCEIFANFGQNMTFEDQKRILNWVFIFGIDLICQHLTLYTLRGRRKRDCPPSFNYHQPWWDYLHHVNDRLARISFMLTRGRHVADILVLHPVSSAWCVYHAEDQDPALAINDPFIKLSESLLSIHRDYDYGDELIMRRHARVVGDRIQVGCVDYAVVIIPPSLTMFQETLDLLRAFAEGGGKILAIEPLPQRVDGTPNEAVEEFLGQHARVVTGECNALSIALDEIMAPSVRLESHGRHAELVYCHERRLDDKRIYFLFNTDCDAGTRCRIQVDVPGQLEIWDDETGDISPLPSQVSDGGVAADLAFAPAESRIVVLDQTKEALIGSPVAENDVETIKIDPPWQLERHELNALMLDYCDYQIEGEAWRENVPLLFDLSRYAYGDPPEPVKRMLAHSAEGCPLNLRFRFEVEQMPSFDAPLYLVMETPGDFDLKLNGTAVTRIDEEFWIDPAFRKLDIRGLVQPGVNLLEASMCFGALSEIESFYIVGDFGVRRKSDCGFAVVNGVDQVRGRDLGEEGLPFYCGQATLTKEVDLPSLADRFADRLYLDVRRMDAVVTEVFVNGESAGVLAWRDWQIEISRFVSPGRNRVSLKLVGSLRNLLGMHHDRRDEHMSAIAALQPPNPETWEDRYNFVPFGVDGVSCRYVQVR